MFWRLGTLAAVLAWLFLASPAVLAADQRADSGIEVRNGTRTQNLAHLTRTLLSLQGFNVVQIGNYIDFGVAATVIYYRTEAEKVARALQSEIFPGARLEASSTLKNGVDLKVLLGSDLLAQPRMRARLLGEEPVATPPAIKAPTPEPGPPPRPVAAKETAAPVSASPPAMAAATAAKSGASPRRIVLAAAERADTGIEVRNGTRTQNLAHLTRSLLSLQGFNVVQIGNYIDFGVAATVIYYRTEAEKVARALQSEIFPGAGIEESSRLKNGVDIKVLLGHDLEVQPRMRARLLGEELAASPSAVKAPTPEPGPPPRSLSAQETAATASVSAPALAAAAAANSGASPRRIVLAAAERADTGIEVRNGTRTQNLAHLTRTLLSLQGFNVVQIGNYIDFGVAATVIYYRTEAEKVARALQSEIFPGAGIEESSRLKNGVDIKVLLGHDLEVQPRMLARLLGEELAAPPPAVKAPTPEPGPPPRSLAAKETLAPASASTQATAEPESPPALPSRNAAPSQPAPSQPASPNRVSEAMITEPRRDENRHARLVGQTEETYTPESVLDAIRKACQDLAPTEAPAPEFDGVILAAEQAAASQKTAPPAILSSTERAKPESPPVLPATASAPKSQSIPPSSDFGVAAPMVYSRTEVGKMARALQSKIFPGISLAESYRLKDGEDLKVWLGHDLEVQPRMLARLVGEELAAPPPAVKAPTPEPVPPPRSLAATEMAAPASVSAPATAELEGSPSPAPPALPAAMAAAAASQPGASQGHADSGGMLHIGNVAPSQATPSQPTPSQPDRPSAVREAMIAEPRRSQDRHVRLVGQTEETYNPEADLDAIQKACQGLVRGEAPAHEFDGISVAAGQAATEKAAAEVAATGDIQRYRDARGVLHLNNVTPSQPTPSQPTPSQPDSPSAVREAMIAEPRRSQDRHVRLVGQTEETYNPEADLDAIQKACQGLARSEAPAHEFDGISVAAGQAAAEKETVEVAMDVSQVSQDQGVIPAPAPQPAAPKTAAAAAAGDIQRYRDARGVLHLSNVPPSQPTPSQPDSPSAVREAMIAEPRRSQDRHVRLAGQTEETYNPEADLAAIQKACQGLVRGEAPAREFDGIIVAAQQAAAEKAAAEVAADYNYLPVSRVAQDQGDIPAPAPQPAAPKTAEAAAAGDIQRYRDARGVLHLSNATPGAEDLGAAVQMAQSSNNQDGEARQMGQPAAMLPRQPFRQAAWSPEDPLLATLPTTPLAAKQAPPDSPSPVWEYRDSKSVIHISNVDAKPREAPAPDSLMAGTAAGSEPLARRPRPVAVETAGGLAWRPAAWNGEDGIKPFKRAKKAPSQTAEVITEGGIRRYRDAKGIIHIKTVEYPLPPGVVLPPRQPDPYLMAPVAAAPTAPVISNLPGSATAVPPANPATLSGASPRINAFKDAKGRFRITTELPPPVPGEMPPLPVYAELEPIIQEAAQIHRLPPTLIKAVIKAESNFCSWAVSPKGAMGLMQLMPGTADLLGVREPFNPRDNILGGCRYLRELVDLFGGNLPLALASYNAGFQRVIDCGYQIPSIKETQDFVTTVMGRYVAEETRGRQPST